MATYEVKVKGSVSRGSNLESADTVNTDSFGNEIIQGEVVNAADTWNYDGEILDLTVPSGFAMDINGKRVNPNEVLQYYAKKLVLTSGADLKEYEFTTDGKILPGPDAELGGNDSVTQNSDGSYTATGAAGNNAPDSWWVLGGFDKSRTSIPSNWTIEYDGQQLEDQSRLPDANQVETTEIEVVPNNPLSGAEYIIQTSGTVTAKSSVEEEDKIENGNIAGTLYSKSDVFTLKGGKVSALFIPQGCSVLLDGKDINAGPGTELRIEPQRDLGGSKIKVDIGQANAILRGEEAEDADVHSNGVITATVGGMPDNFYVYTPDPAPTWEDVTLPSDVGPGDVNIYWAGNQLQEPDANSPPNLGDIVFNGYPAPNSIHVGEQFTVALTSVSDPDGDFSGPLEWDLGDGTTTTGPDATHSYSSTGTYTIQVTGKDAHGATTTKKHTVDAVQSNRPPQLGEFVMNGNPAPSSVEAGKQLTFALSEVSDPDGNFSPPLEWSVTKGGSLVKSTTGPDITVSFRSAGSAEVNVVAKDAQGASTQGTHQLDVKEANARPNAAISTTVDGETVTLDASQSTDDVGIQSYEWSVGNRNYTGQTVRDTFSPGTYQVNLRVTDGAGATDTASTSFTVEDQQTGGGGSDVPWGAILGAGGLAYLLSNRGSDE